MSSSQIFLRFTMPRSSIRGEATAGGYEGTIELDGYSWSMSSKYSLRQDANRVQAQLNYDKLKVKKLYDVSSIQLAAHLQGRIKFTKAEIIVDHHVRPTGERPDNPALVIELRDGFIEDIRLSISEAKLAATLKEDVSLSFKNFKITYFPGSENKGKRLGAMSFETAHAAN